MGARQRLRVISCGCGHQSTALVVLATQGRLGVVDAVVWANVGDDSEHPGTIRYAREVLAPFCAGAGLPFHEVSNIDADGNPVTLYEHMMRPESMSFPIPLRGSESGAPGSRSCTFDFKVKIIRDWLQANGATADNPADVLIGFSTDESHRVGGRRNHPIERAVFPLLDPDIDLSLSQCGQVIRDAGLPLPPRSSCYFCPFHKVGTWAEMRRDDPGLFAQAVHVETTINQRRTARRCDLSGQRAEHDTTRNEYVFDAGTRERLPLPPGRSALCPECGGRFVVRTDGTWPDHQQAPRYLSSRRKPLALAIPEAGPSLFSDAIAGEIETCDDGGCFT